MKRKSLVPDSLKSAACVVRNVLRCNLPKLSKSDFLRVWGSIAYLFPGLHPDGFEHPESGWPRVLKPIATEAWRRANAGDLTDGELYLTDSSWSGIFDRMHIHFRDEVTRRAEISSPLGFSIDG
jgi:hypothetical protein